MNNNKRFIISLVFFIILLSIFAIFSTRIDFHDSTEYIGVAKEFAGIGNSRVYTGHSTVYPLFLAQFLKIFPYYITIKLINIIWFILIGILLYYLNKHVSALILWIFAPIAWWTSIIVSPIVPSTFFLFLGYYAIKKWKVNKKTSYFAISALSLGISSSLWAGSIFFAIFLAIAFLYKYELKTFLYYVILFIPTFSIRLIADQIFFGFPLYSYAREFGVPIMVFLGLNKSVQTLPATESLLALVIISPLLFLLYKLKFSENKEETIFLVLSVLFILSYQAILTYFMFIAPILIALLNKIFKKWHIILHSIVSIFIIILITKSYFGENFDTLLATDLTDINKDFNFEKVIAGDINKQQGFASDRLNAVYWGFDKPFILWESDFNLYLQNKTSMTEYNFKVNPKINTIRRPEISIRMKMDSNQVFENLPLILLKTDKQIPSNYELATCYRVLCVYQTMKT